MSDGRSDGDRGDDARTASLLARRLCPSFPARPSASTEEDVLPAGPCTTARSVRGAHGEEAAAVSRPVRAPPRCVTASCSDPGSRRARGLVPALPLPCAHAAGLPAEPRGTGQCPGTVIAELPFLGVAVTTAWPCLGTAGDSPPGAKGHSRGTALGCSEGKGGTEPSAPSATSDPGATPAPSARHRGRHRPPWVTQRRGDGRGGCPCAATVPAWLSPWT